MGKSSLAAMFLAGFLLSCSATPKTDALEAKARQGDPVAACQLAARDIRACALEKQVDDLAILKESLACYDTMLDDRKKGYLDKAAASMRAKPGAGGMMYSLAVMRLNLTAAVLPVLNATEARQQTTDLEQECADLSKYAG